MRYFVFMAHGGASWRSSVASMLAIVEITCTRWVAGYQWFENYCKMADEKGISLKTVDYTNTFKFR